MKEVRIGSYYIYPNGAPINCQYRVWLGSKPVCIKEVGAAIVVTEDTYVEAPECSKQICLKGS